MNWFILLCYIIFSFGISIIFTQSDGPFDIFYRIRMWAEDVDDNFGLLFRCMTCFPTNVGIIFSLFNWFLIPDIQISPFNMILHGTDLWWLAAIMDGCFTGGICHFWGNIDDYIDKTTPMYEDEEKE